MGRAKAGSGLARRKRSQKTECMETRCGEPSTKLSLPVISNEKLCCVDDDAYIMKTLQNSGAGDASAFALPKVKISCEALKYERIIDLANNNVIPKKAQKPKRAPRKRTARTVKNKTEKNQKPLNVIRVTVHKTVKKTEQQNEKTPMKGNVKKPVEKKTVINCDKKPNVVSVSVKNSKLPENNPQKGNKEILNMVDKGSLQICGKKSVLYNFGFTAQQRSRKNNSLASTFKDSNEHSSTNLNNGSLNTQDTSCSLFDFLDDGPACFDINLQKFVPSINGLKMKFGDNACKKNKNVEEITSANILNKAIECNYSRDVKNDLESGSGDAGLLGKISLQTAVETFISNPQVKYLKGSTALKRGLCFSWLSNNYVCLNQQCLYNHNALNLFTRKLKRYPSKFIMSVVVSMKQDHLFVDVAMAAFKVISERQIPVVWVTFLTFFVFYVTEPSDSRFIKFWAVAAKFFCDLQKNCSATSGFASLLAIFTHIEDSEQWKIFEFIKLIKQPPVQICVNFTLLQPVLKMELPLEFLTGAIESCITTQKDVLKVYCLIVPKIPIMTSPIQIVELLLRLCKTLGEVNHKDLADDLKQRLREKVWSVHSKIPHHMYPLTASFQEELSICSNEENCLVPSVGLPNEKKSPDVDLPFFCGENDFFRPEEDFCNLMAQALEFSTDAIPRPFRSTDDVGERQLTRIKQFFRDCQFDLLGKYLNELKPNMTERAAEEFLKLLFQMKISLEQGVDLIKIILLACKSHSAAKVIASISITFVLNLVRINEWEKAYTIVSLCQEKQISLVEGKVYYTNDFNAVTQCRIALLLIEIYAYKENYGNALDLVKKYFLFSANNSVWQVASKSQDEIIRVRILEDLLKQIIEKQLTQEAYDLFGMIWKDQKQLAVPVDLRTFVNDILVLLLNQDNEEALNLYEQVKTEGVLSDTTVRAMVVTLVRRNRLSDAKSLVLSSGQNAYFAPKITHNSATVKVLSFWLEEEIFAMFDAFFDLLVSNKTSFNPEDYNNVEIQLEESRPNSTSRTLRPLCLGIITLSLKDACNRIQRVLQQQFNPPLKLIIMPYYLKLDEFSVKLHLHKRMQNLNF